MSVWRKQRPVWIFRWPDSIIFFVSEFCFVLVAHVIGGGRADKHRKVLGLLLSPEDPRRMFYHVTSSSQWVPQPFSSNLLWCKGALCHETTLSKYQELSLLNPCSPVHLHREPLLTSLMWRASFLPLWCFQYWFSSAAGLTSQETPYHFCTPKAVSATLQFKHVC